MASRESYLRNREKILERQREYYQKNKEVIKNRTRDWYEKNKERAKENAKKNAPRYRAQKNARSKIRWRELRAQLIHQVSNGTNRCVRCGFSDMRALQVDHINGGGRAEVRNSKFRNPYRYGLHIAKTPDDYQVLCANCNWIKRDENGEYKKR